MGLFGNLVGAAVKTVLTPVAIVKDVVSVAIGEDADNTKKLTNDVVEDLSNAVDDLSEGEL